MDYQITITNGKVQGFDNGYYVGRYNRQYNLSQSKLANPFVIGKDGDRTEVLEKYRKWLWKQIKTKNFLVCKELQELAKLVKIGEEVNLICWCHPQACHADIIKKCLLWIVENKIDLI